jgi:RNA polymerase sigma factor (sigma-70 family)
MDKLQSGRCELTEDELKFIADLYEKHSKALLKYATIILDKQNGEEAVQNVFWILCRKDKKDANGEYKIEKIMKYDDPVGWLYKTLRFSIQKIIRKKQQYTQLMVYTPPQADTEFGIEIGMEDFPDERPIDEDVDFLYSDLANDKEFKLIKEFSVDDKSLKTMADKYGVSIRAVEQRLYRARKKLQKTFSNKK